MAFQPSGGKLPGKTAYAGRRRPMTRKSGYKVHDDTTGGEFKRVSVPSYTVRPGEVLTVSFQLPSFSATDFLGFGAWFHSDKPAIVIIEEGPGRRTLTEFDPPNWNKVGSIWKAADTTFVKPIKLSIRPKAESRVAVWGESCGIVRHEHLQTAREELLPNMYQCAPEAVFLQNSGKNGLTVSGRTPSASGQSVELILKSCNRCGRYQPCTGSCLAASNVPCIGSHGSAVNKFVCCGAINDILYPQPVIVRDLFAKH